jgi:dihydroorotase
MEGTYKNGPNGVAPDGFTLRNGVTTIVDAGSSGWRSFPVLKKQTIDISQTRVLAMLNIVGDGMRKGIYEQNVSDMDPVMAANSARQYKDHIVGIKVAHFASPSFVAVDRGVEAAGLAGLPLMVDFGGTKQLLSPDSQELSIEELFMDHLRPGDIFTHTYALTAGREPIVDEDDKVKPFVFKARERGIIFDAGYGGGSFKFSQAIPASKADFYPHTIGTDLHTNSMNNGMRDMLNLMSIFLALDMDLPSVIKASTWSPAKAIKREELGHLSPGSIADVAVLNMHSGKFGFYDPVKYKIEGKQRLECEMTIIGGKVVYDRNGMSIPLGVNN